jgi:hypothetical protein
MKKIFTTLFFIMLAVSLYGQSRDVVYLKNGSIIKGIIIENVINENVKIQTSDGSIHVLPYSDITKLGKETETSTEPVLALMQTQTIILPTPDSSVNNGKMTANGSGFFIGGRRISVAEAKVYSAQYSEAMKHIRKGQGVYAVAMVMALGGGGLVGWQLGAAIGGGDISAGGLVAGLLVTGGAFGLSAITINQYKKAAAAYNIATGLAELPQPKMILALTPTSGGLGLQLTF